VNDLGARAAPRASGTACVADVAADLARTLRNSGMAEPRRLATDVIAALLEVPRSWPALNGDAPLDQSTVAAARTAAKRLRMGAPFAYAVGTACFRHLVLTVDERVLIPRPETEVLVDEIFDRMRGSHGSWGTAVDIGTGSGAIALALATEGNFDRVIATDASEDVLAVARLNCDRLSAALRSEVEILCGSLTSPVRGVKAAVLVSNPPYVAFAEAAALPPGVRDWEPPIALYSGHDGMSATAEIVRGAADVLIPGGLLALEVDERRASLVAELIMSEGCYTEVGVRLDLTGRERFVLATRT